MKCAPAPLPLPEVLDISALAAAYASGKVDLIVVLGPTASGKTKYAVRLAGELERACGSASSLACVDPGFASDFGAASASSALGTASGAAFGAASGAAEIISADSRQVYRGMDIGTGKDLADYGGVPYHLIDIAPAGSQYNVYEFQRDFAAAWQDIRSRGRIPILCGGTGMYISAVTAGYDFRTKAALSSAKELPARDDLPRRPYFIGTLVSRDQRNARIDARLDARLREGMLDEIRSLLDGGVPAQTLIGYGLEYKFVTLYLMGELTFEQMRAQLATAIHQFAKRQMTWFRGMERSGVAIHWVEP